MPACKTKSKNLLGTVGDRIIDAFYTKGDKSYLPSLSGGRISFLILKLYAVKASNVLALYV